MKTHDWSRFFTTLLIIMLVAPMAGADDVLHVYRDDEQYPPFEMLDDNNRLTGFHIELIRAAAKAANLDVTFHSVPWKRALLAMKEGEGDAVSYISKNSERSEYLVFDERNIMSEVRHQLMVVRGLGALSEFDGRLDSLNGSRIGVVRGFSYGEVFDMHTGFERVFANGQPQLIDLLAYQRVDAIVVYPLNLDFGLLERPGAPDYKLLAPPITSHPAYIAFSRKTNPQKLQRFSQGMAEFKASEAYQKLRGEFRVDLKAEALALE